MLASRLTVMYIFVYLMVGVLIGGCTALKEAKLLDPLENGLVEIAPRVYVSEDMSAAQRQKLLEEITKAKPKLVRVFGSVTTHPAVYAFTNRNHYESLGGYGSGRAVKDGIMLMPKAMNSCAIAHEWTHVELYARVKKSGYRKLPMWFHEGLATFVGCVPQHSEAVWQEAVHAGYPIPPLDELKTISDWMAAFRKYSNPKRLNIVYATAGHEVRNWYKRAGQKGLLELLNAMREDGKFKDVYGRY